MNNIVIIGAGDLGKEVVWLIEDINKINPTFVILGFLDDDLAKGGGEFYGYRVLGRVEQLDCLAKTTSLYAIIAIQNGTTRKKIKEEHNKFENWVTIIHPTAVIAPSSVIGKGSIVFPHVTISVDTKVGDFNLLYINSTVCNDCIIGDFVSIMSGASVSERVEIGNECFLSAGSTIYPHIKLKEKTEIRIEAIAK